MQSKRLKNNMNESLLRELIDKRISGVKKLKLDDIIEIDCADKSNINSSGRDLLVYQKEKWET